MFLSLSSVSLVLVATLDAAVAVASSSPPRQQQRPQRPWRGSVTDAAAGPQSDRPALLRLRGGVRMLQEGEWEDLHEAAGEKLVVVGASRRCPTPYP